MFGYLVLNIGFVVICILYMEIEPKIKKSQRKYLMGAFLIIFSVLMALRPTETKDTLSYIRGFEAIEQGQEYGITFLQKYMGYELGYIYLVRFYKLFSDNYRLFFFFIALIGSTLSLVGLKKIRDKIVMQKTELYGVIFALYVSNFGLLYNGIAIRAGLAMGLGIYAVSLMLEEKRWKAVLFFVLAFTIQRTSILFVAMYFILKYMPVLKMKVHITIWGISGVMLFTGLGSQVLGYIIDILSFVITRFQISGYGAYLVNLNIGVGLRDIYIWLLYGVFIFLLNTSEYYKRVLNVIMFGALIVVFMHDVRAIARAYDMFYLFTVPALERIYNGNSIIKIRGKKLIVLMILCMNTILMLRLCFV